MNIPVGVFNFGGPDVLIILLIGVVLFLAFLGGIVGAILLANRLIKAKQKPQPQDAADGRDPG